MTFEAGPETCLKGLTKGEKKVDFIWRTLSSTKRGRKLFPASRNSSEISRFFVPVVNVLQPASLAQKTDKESPSIVLIEKKDFFSLAVYIER